MTGQPTAEVAAHYEQLLAHHYTWMLGDFDAAVEEQRALLESCGLSGPGTALDLGCGSGIHSFALAQLGYDDVVAVDLSQTLLAELTRRAVDQPAIRPIRADLTDGLAAVVSPRSAAAVVCMGDTLPHLPDNDAVRRLLADTADVLAPGGLLVLSFRDLTTPLEGLDRFIPVLSDERRIMTCFLEDAGDAVRVHDLVHSRGDDGEWRLEKSSYRKLRLAPERVAGELRSTGFDAVSVTAGPRGMCLVTARRPT